MPRLFPQLLALAVLVALCAPLAQAQEKPESEPRGIYSVGFAVYEKEDSRLLNTRRYSVQLEEGGYCIIRANSRVPILLEEGKFDYQDVGLNLDCKIRRRGDHAALEVSFELSDFAAPGQQQARQPLLRTIRSRLDTAVALDSPTIVSQVDDAATKRRYELEVTVKKVK
ncbi:MAG: hypothetical protein ACRD4D_06405 [Candidatus Acidiferrales bacterium]